MKVLMQLKIKRIAIAVIMEISHVQPKKGEISVKILSFTIWQTIDKRIKKQKNQWVRVWMGISTAFRQLHLSNSCYLQ